MADKDQLITEFCQLTGADNQTAGALLEAHQWDLNGALSTFYEDQPPNPVVNIDTPKSTNISSSSVKQPIASSDAGYPANSARVATLGNVRSLNQPASSGDGQQNFFAGGAKSGMMVQGPADPSKAPVSSLIENIMKQAAGGGRHSQSSEEENEDEEYEEGEEDRESHGQTKKPPSFQGTGFTLGSETVQSRTIQSQAGGEESRQLEGSRETVSRTLTFWKNGFSIEDGPLMRYDDPQSQQILESIQRGQAPMSLFNVRPGQRADVKVAHRMQDEYVTPKAKPFSGSGQRLGSAVLGDKPVSESSVAPISSLKKPECDESKPHTSLQLRLSDGTRLRAQLNMDHTIGDLRAFIESQRPSTGRYILQTQFPTRILDDPRKTLSDYGLKNAAIFQKYA